MTPQQPTKHICILLLFLLLCPALAWAEVEVDYKGNIGFEQWAFPRSGKNSQNNANSAFELMLEGSVSNGAWQTLAAPRVKIDVIEERRNRVTADEAWVQYSSDAFEVRVGLQTFFWGTVESVNIVDVLNQRDYESDFLDPYKWGELSALVSYFTDDYTFEFYYLPYFRTATFPSRYSRYSFTNGTVDISKKEYLHGGSNWDPQGAFRVSRTIGSADMAVSFFHGWARFPVLALEPGKTELTPYYYKENTLSYDIQMAVGAWLVKGELVYKNTDINSSLVRNSVETGGRVLRKNLVPSSYVAYVLGLEYKFENIVGSNDIVLLAEYLGDSNRGEKTPDYRIYQNDIFLAFRYNLNDANDKKLEVGGFISLEKCDEVIYSVKYSQRFLDEFTFKFEYLGLAVSEEDSPLSIFKEDGRLSAKVVWSF